MNSFVTLLQLMFIGLKLAGLISWSWWWVMSPLLICAALAVLCMIGTYIYIEYIETPQERAARLLEAYAKRMAER